MRDGDRAFVDERVQRVQSVFTLADEERRIEVFRIARTARHALRVQQVVQPGLAPAADHALCLEGKKRGWRMKIQGVARVASDLL